MFRNERCNSLEAAEAHAGTIRRLWLLGNSVSFVAFSRLLRRLTAVQEIRLGWQSWMALPKELAYLTELRSLTVLNIPVQNFPAFLATCPKLTELVLRDTDITTIPASIREFRGLRQLDVSNNPLTQLPSELGLLPELQELIVTEAGLTTLPDALSALKHLRRLMLTGNRLTQAEALRIRSWFADGVVSASGTDEVAV